MLPERPRIGVIGAGALGGFYGARLARAGHDVHFVMRRDYDHVRRHGLEVRSFEGNFSIRPLVYSDAASLGVCDLVIVGLKSTDNGALPDLLGPTVGPESLVLTLQNGLGNEEAIEAVLSGTEMGALRAGPPAGERILGGIAFLCSNRVGPGVISHIDHGWIRLGEFRRPVGPRTAQVADLFRSAGIVCEIYDSLLQARWEKLVWNVPFNGLGVAARAHTEAILADEELLLAARGLMEEVIAAAAGDSVRLGGELADQMVANTRSMGPYRTSMQIDYEEGRPLEVEAILGEPLRRGRRAGAAIPKLQMLYALVHQLNSVRTR